MKIVRYLVVIAAAVSTLLPRPRRVYKDLHKLEGDCEHRYGVLLARIRKLSSAVQEGTDTYGIISEYIDTNICLDNALDEQPGLMPDQAALLVDEMDSVSRALVKASEDQALNPAKL